MDASPRKRLTLGLAAAGALVLLVLAWGLWVLVQAMADQGRSIRAQVLSTGEERRMELARTNFRVPTPPLPPPPLMAGSPGPSLVARQHAVLLGKKVLWALPQGPVPLVDSPGAQGESVQRAGTLWVYVCAIEDGRTFVATFDSPSYDRTRARQMSVAALQTAFVAGALILVALLALRVSRMGQAERMAGEAERGALDGEGLDQATPAVVALFQQTLKELRARTEELEEMHRRQRRRAEDVEGLAEALFANLEAGYLRFDQEGRLAGVNAAARSLLGLREVPRLGLPAEKVLEEREDLLQVLREVLASRTIVLRDEVGGAGDLALQVLGIPLYNSLNQLRGHLLLLRDMGPVYQMRRTLREREALSRLGEVAAGVAHEVRNALNTLSVRLRLMEQDVPPLSQNPNYTALKEETANLEQVMQNLLFFARPLPILREELSLRGLLEEAARGLAPGFPTVSFGVEAEEDLAARADADALGRALRNLARNAAESASPGGERRGHVRLSAARSGREVRICVEDDGPGVPVESRGALFTPFFSQKPGGTGLGLAIARKVAREHGGDLVYFESDLGGAGFRLTLPLDA